ncbi:hypothetical protein DPMN_127962 [Dreissena polymorpha]|uniref:Uncharacterized protein n=1 Tax=Dreissena polymorpha TaxID=45954 RepID=A0A9D4JVY2_DREPO|nr:hypothetical protein DPMN_127962 [Dreissena polymorpha]
MFLTAYRNPVKVSETHFYPLLRYDWLTIAWSHKPIGQDMSQWVQMNKNDNDEGNNDDDDDEKDDDADADDHDDNDADDNDDDVDDDDKSCRISKAFANRMDPDETPQNVDSSGFKLFAVLIVFFEKN